MFVDEWAKLDESILCRAVISFLLRSYEYKRKLVYLLEDLKRLAPTEWITKMLPTQLADILVKGGEIEIDGEYAGLRVPPIDSLVSVHIASVLLGCEATGHAVDLALARVEILRKELNAKEDEDVLAVWDRIQKEKSG